MIPHPDYPIRTPQESTESLQNDFFLNPNQVKGISELRVFEQSLWTILEPKLSNRNGRIDGIIEDSEYYIEKSNSDFEIGIGKSGQRTIYNRIIGRTILNTGSFYSGNSPIQFIWGIKLPKIYDSELEDLLDQNNISGIRAVSFSDISTQQDGQVLLGQVGKSQKKQGIYSNIVIKANDSSALPQLNKDKLINLGAYYQSRKEVYFTRPVSIEAIEVIQQSLVSMATYAARI